MDRAYKVDPMWGRRVLTASLGALLAVGATLTGVANAQASTTIRADAVVPAVVAEAGSTYLPSTETDKPYRESTITYTGKTTYYFLTQDTAYAARNGDTVYVSFDGTSGTAADTGTADGVSVFAAEVIYMAGGTWSNANLLRKADATIFIDPGTYHYTQVANYLIYTSDDLALIGLEKGQIIFTRAPYRQRLGSSGAGNPYTERISATGNGLMFQNLVFDGQGSGLIGNSALSANVLNQWSTDGGGTWLSSGSVYASSRGGNVVQVGGANDFLMRDTEIRNFNTGYSGASGYAVSVVSPSGAALSTAQVNLERITVTDVKGSTSNSYRIVMIGTHPNVNIRDMAITDTAASPLNRDALWVESPGSSGMHDSATDVRFDGEVTITGFTNDRIGAQLTSFANITPPKDYRWAAFMVGNASPSMSVTNQAAVLFYKDLADFNQNWPTSNNSKFVLYDVQDNAWIVREPSSANGVVPTIEQQLTAINTIMQRMNGAQDTINGGRHGRGLVSDVYVKVVADVNGEFPQFTVPAMATSYSADTPNVHIRAVATPETPFWTPIVTTGDMVPAPEGGQWELDATSAANVRIYGVDFSTVAHYTLYEAITGGTVQDQDTVVGTTDPAVKGSSADTFVLCEFSALVEALHIDGETSPGVKEIKIDDATTLVGIIDSGWTDTSENGAITQYVPDDDTLVWSSSDLTVATIDPDTGELTALSLGEATITVCAVDTYSQGEFQRPCASLLIKIVKADDPITPGGPDDPNAPTGGGVGNNTLLWPIAAAMGIAGAGLVGFIVIKRRRVESVDEPAEEPTE